MTAFDPEKITFFAKTDARGQGVSFGIKAKDRQRHMYVVGKTGMGKSTLLENMAAQDIMNGEGVAFIDPHGSAAENLLEYVPAHRVKDVVYFAPFDLEHPVSFNVMEDVGPDKRHLVVSGLMSTFKKIWVDAWSARMEYILTNALLVLIEYPESTLLSVNRLFSDKAYRKKVVEHCKDPAVKSFWVDEFANYTDRFTAEALPAIQNKIGQFTGNPLIRNIIGQPHSSFDIRELMDNKKIIIMNLSKGLIGETNANLLGSMLTTRIYLAAMSRSDLPVEQMSMMPNFYFYVDEFQSFANATFANILSEARKYHLNLIIAHQYIAQMEEEVRDAVFGNVGTTVAFRVGPFDAEVLETVFTPRFLAADLVNLGFAQIYLTLMIDGIGSQPFSAKTLPKIEPPEESHKAEVIEYSRKLYAGEREKVNKLVDELHTPQNNPQQNQQGQKQPQKKGFDNKGGNNNYQNNSPRNNSQPDNRKPNQNNQNYQRQDSQNNEQVRRPKPPEKTPEDLRNILSKISGNERKEVAGKDVQKLEVKKSIPSQQKSNQEIKKTPQTDSKPVDLRQALADVLEKASKPAESKEQKKIDTAQEIPHISESRQSSETKPPVRKVVVESQRRMVSGSVNTDTPTDKEDKNPSSSLDLAEIKRMLRHNENEKSPFN